jgi:hypothetical protein
LARFDRLYGEGAYRLQEGREGGRALRLKQDLELVAEGVVRDR